MDYKDIIKDKRLAKLEKDKQEAFTSDVKSIADTLKRPVEVSVSNIDFNKLSDAFSNITMAKGEKGDKGDKGNKGKDGKTPKKGVDYFTDKEVTAISNDIMGRIRVPEDGYTPVKGVDYYTESEIQGMIKDIVKRIPRPKDGQDGRDVILDYDKLVKDVVAKIPKPKDGKDGVNTFVNASGKNPYATIGYSKIKELKAGTNVTIDNTDPEHPVISATGGGSGTDDHSALTNLAYADSGHTGFQPAGSYLTDISGQDLSTANNTTSAFITAGDIPAIPTSVDDLSPTQTGNSGKFLKTDGTNATWESIPGGGDMLASTYDPAAGAKQVAFSDDARFTDSRTPTSHGNEAHSSTFITAGDIPAIPVKASGAEINAGTDDAKFATSKAISDSRLARIITGTSSTARTTAAKVTTIADYTLRAGDTLAITFSDGFHVDNATLNVNDGGAVNIRAGAVNVTTALLSVAAGTSFTLNLYYDGTHFYIPGSQLNTNTTYTEISEAEITTGTASTLRSISGRRSEFIVTKARAGKQDTLVNQTNIKSINGTTLLGSGDLTTPNTTYTAGTGLTLTGTQFSNDNPTPYTLPTATADTLGGIKVGTNLSITEGVLSATDTNTTYTAGTGLTLTSTEFAVTNPVTPAATGFTITAGTTPKTLTVALDASVAGTNTGDQTLPTRDSLGLDTDDSPQFTGVNIGHATDTTITRVSAGVVAIEGNNIITANTLLNLTYPVGAIYQSTVSTSPATLFGGTWAAIENMFLVGKGSGTFATAGATGGAETVTLTAAQSGVPAHAHPIKVSGSTTAGYSGTLRNNANDGEASGYVGNNTAANASQSHNNLPPYKVVYMWERTA